MTFELRAIYAKCGNSDYRGRNEFNVFRGQVKPRRLERLVVRHRAAADGEKQEYNKGLADVRSG